MESSDVGTTWQIGAAVSRGSIFYLLRRLEKVRYKEFICSKLAVGR
jgi:hypothetical protein